MNDRTDDQPQRDGREPQRSEGDRKHDIRVARWIALPLGAGLAIWGAVDNGIDVLAWSKDILTAQGSIGAIAALGGVVIGQYMNGRREEARVEQERQFALVDRQDERDYEHKQRTLQNTAELLQRSSRQRGLSFKEDPRIDYFDSAKALRDTLSKFYAEELIDHTDAARFAYSCSNMVEDLALRQRWWSLEKVMENIYRAYSDWISDEFNPEGKFNKDDLTLTPVRKFLADVDLREWREEVVKPLGWKNAPPLTAEWFDLHVNMNLDLVFGEDNKKEGE